ncbi:MAG: DUF354 domain-containing protein [Archaeoglobus sp.]|nr:DUF354 domain-containing protein [Archaeoglobus sp.]
MRILVGVGHPAHVHFYKNAIFEWKKNGHEVLIAARSKDVTLHLLDKYNLDYVNLGKSKKGLVSKGLKMIKNDYFFIKLIKKFKPDVLTGIHDPYIAQTGELLGVPSIVFTDTELVRFTWLVFPFADFICTPSCFLLELGKKHVRFNGYKELAYLHPKYFKPDPAILRNLDLSKKDSLIVVRFISWSAYHDIGLSGVKGSELGFIKKLEEYGSVFIVSERPLRGELEKYRTWIPPEEIHSLLYFSDLYIGEGGTMATEAAILGTPSIHIESTQNGVASGEFLGNFLELRNKYGLMYFYPDQKKAIQKAVDILENGKSKKEWKIKRKKLLRDKVDVTEWMVDFVESCFPEVK